MTGESDGYTPQPLARRVADAVRVRGMRPVAGDFARWGTEAVLGLPWMLQGEHGAFVLDGRRYSYAHCHYKLSWLTERAVEVPVTQAVVDAHAGRRVLEVGNVLSHFRPQNHVVVDKYEHAPGVLNRDAVDLADLGSFDLIVAISTLEHVGWDERPREPGKAVEAAHALRRLLAPGGTLVITVPAGYNPALDAALRDGTIALSASAALRRVGRSRFWEDVAPEDVWSAPYDVLLYAARGVLVAHVEAPPG